MMKFDCNFETKIAECELDPKVTKVLIKHNINTIEQLTNLTLPELKKIKGLGRLGVPEIMIFLKRNRLKLTPSEKKIDPQLGFKKKLMEKFLKNYKECDFGKELRAATAMLKLKPEEFWEKLSLTFKLNSLFFFLSQSGKEVIFKASIDKKEIPTVTKERIELSETKVGDDIVIHKPKSIKDFLNGR